MKIITSILISLLVILLSSCQSDDDNPNEENNSNERLFLKSYSLNGDLMLSFSYENGKTKTVMNNLGAYPIREEYDYSSSNEIIVNVYSEDDEFLNSRKYFKVNEEISRFELYNYDGSLSRYFDFYFDGNNCGYHSLKVYDRYDELKYRLEVNFGETNCNKKVIRYNELNEVQFSDDIIYDSKDSPFFSYLDENFYRLSKEHNAKSIIKRDSNGEIENEYSYNSVFEYNSNNYPIKETRNYLNGEQKIFTFEYYSM